jgi:hypothetical protein
LSYHISIQIGLTDPTDSLCDSYYERGSLSFDTGCDDEIFLINAGLAYRHRCPHRCHTALAEPSPARRAACNNRAVAGVEETGSDGRAGGRPKELTMNNNKRQTAIAGIFLIGLGLVWWLDLWFLLLPGALAAAGVVGYLQRRAAGRQDEALHIALWGLGLAVLFLTNFLFPGILFLAGASVLLRGREQQAIDRVRSTAMRVRGRVRPSRAAEQVPIETVGATIVPISQNGTSVGETTRLK